MNEYTIEDLKQTSALEFRAVPTGRMIQAGNGRMKAETKGVNYVPTRVGRLDEDEWYNLMEDAIRREGKEELLLQIEEHCRQHCAWLHKEKEIRAYAMSCLSSEAYKKWEDFKNEKSR